MGNEQKTPLTRSLSIFGSQKALDEIAKTGVALPGHVVAVSGAIVTVAFDVPNAALPQVQMPLFGGEWVRYPTQVGDKGVAFPASVYIGQTSGLGGYGKTNATIGSTPGNLSTLVFFPIGNKNWTASPGGPNVLTLYGPQGVQIQDEAGQSVATVTPTGITLNGKSAVTIEVGGTQITLSSSQITVNGSTNVTLKVGGETIVITSTGVAINSRTFLLHTHSGVSTGGGVTGPVV